MDLIKLMPVTLTPFLFELTFDAHLWQHTLWWYLAITITVSSHIVDAICQIKRNIRRKVLVKQFNVHWSCTVQKIYFVKIVQAKWLEKNVVMFLVSLSLSHQKQRMILGSYEFTWFLHLPRLLLLVGCCNESIFILNCLD